MHFQAGMPSFFYSPQNIKSEISQQQMIVSDIIFKLTLWGQSESIQLQQTKMTSYLRRTKMKTST